MEKAPRPSRIKEFINEYYLMALLVLLVSSVGVGLIVKFSYPINVEMSGFSVDRDSIYDGDVKEFVILAQRFAENHEYNVSHYNCMNYTTELKEIADQLGFNLAQRFAENHEYNVSHYNCMNYTTELKEIADQLGFKTEVIRGCPKGGGECHRWLRLKVDFEPQSAMFQDYSSEYPDQQIMEVLK